MERTKQPRRAIAASEKDAVRVATQKAITGEGTLDDSGKLNPQQGIPGGSGLVVLPAVDEDDKKKKGKDDAPKVDETYAAKMYVPILKVIKERRTITGVVIEPDTVDAHKDTIPADVILDAAEDFLANINVSTTLGLMHKDMAPPLELVQSFVVSDSDITINSVIVKKGSWVITVRVNSDSVWNDVKTGKLTGFSIGGTAKVQNLETQAVA